MMLAGKKSLITNGAEGKGQSRDFMARDCGGFNSIFHKVEFFREGDRIMNKILDSHETICPGLN